MDDLAPLERDNICRGPVPSQSFSNILRHHHYLRLGIMRSVFVINTLLMEGDVLPVHFER